jgi:RNA polymerase sigma factor (sigma-70 family)
MEIKINGTVTINTESANSEAATPIDHSKDVLVSNDTTFNELIRILAQKPEAIIAAGMEAKEKEEEAKEEAKEEELRETYGEDYSLACGQKATGRRRPGPAQLRSGYPCVASIGMSDGGKCEVYSNGYAVYDNGNRRTVVWVPDCGSTTYYFGKLRDNEKEYLKEQDEIGQDVMGEWPWHIAVMIAGENRIEYNMDHPKSVGTTSEFDNGDEGTVRASHWYGGSHFDSPEEACLKKEAAEERRRAMTDKQREVYELYFEQGLSQREIAELLGINHRAVGDRLKCINEKMKKIF